MVYLILSENVDITSSLSIRALNNPKLTNIFHNGKNLKVHHLNITSASNKVPFLIDDKAKKYSECGTKMQLYIRSFVEVSFSSEGCWGFVV